MALRERLNMTIDEQLALLEKLQVEVLKILSDNEQLEARVEEKKERLAELKKKKKS